MSLTPLRIDLTDEPRLEALQAERPLDLMAADGDLARAVVARRRAVGPRRGGAHLDGGHGQGRLTRPCRRRGFRGRSRHHTRGSSWQSIRSSARTTRRPIWSPRSPASAKYAEDYRAEGMLFCKLLLSPMPHARVTAIEMSAALAMPGVKAILTADDLPKNLDRRRARADHGAALRGRADSRRRGGRRTDRRRRDRADRNHLRAAAVRRRSAEEPRARRSRRAARRQRLVPRAGDGAWRRAHRRAPRSRR